MLITVQHRTQHTKLHVKECMDVSRITVSEREVKS